LEEAATNPAQRHVAELLKCWRTGSAVDFHFRAMRLRWALLINPSGLTDIESELLRGDADHAFCTDLVVICGEVGSNEARRRLLSWLDDPRFSGYETEILTALHRSVCG